MARTFEQGELRPWLGVMLLAGALVTGCAIDDRDLRTTTFDGDPLAGGGVVTPGGAAGASAAAVGAPTGESGVPITGGLAGGGGDGRSNAPVEGELTNDPTQPVAIAFLDLPATSLFTRTPFSASVVLKNAQGDVVLAATGSITLRLGENPGGANLLGAPTANAASGVAEVTPIGIDQPGVGYTLVASADGLPDATSAPFDVRRRPFERVTTGLYGGEVQQISFGAAPERVMYASTPGGVFRSTNRGLSWSSSNFGNSPAAGGVVADPLAPGVVYMVPSFGSASYAGSGGVVTQSVDGGNSWRPLRGSRQGGVGAFAIDPSNSNRLYAANFQGVYRSLDAGATWEATSLASTTYAIAIDPVTPTTLYAASYELGLFKSTDSGGVWANINNPDLPSLFQITSPVGLVAMPTAVFATGYRTLDGGATWAQVDDSYTYAYAPTNPARVYAGRGTSFRVSNDGGATFGEELNLGVASNSLAVDPEDPARVFVATTGGILLSTDAGVSFADSSVGINIPRLRAIALDPQDPNRLLVASDYGIYRTTNGGIVWQFTAFPFFSVTALYFDPAQPDLAYACIATNLYRSSDGGATWVELGLVGETTSCDDLVSSNGSLYAPTFEGPHFSADGGSTWQATSLTETTYAVAASANGNLFAGTNVGTFRSLDGGTTWTRMTLDLATTILVDDRDPDLVYLGLECGTGATPDADGNVASSNGGILRSRDGGLSWEPAFSSGCIADLEQLPSGDLIAISRAAPFLFRSTDGETWIIGGGGLDGEPEHLAVTPDGQTAYVTTTLGLFRSTTGGL